MINFKPRKCLEILSLCLIYLILIINAIIVKDSLIAFVSAFCGITYTVMAGKGNPFCYVIGVTGSGFYAYLAFHNALWGNLILYLAYYIPMQVLGFFRWRKHLKKDKNEIIKSSLSKKELVLTTLLTAIFSIISILCLIVVGDKSPVIDGITTVFSITGMYLTVKRSIEQWLVWMIVNGLSFIMWFEIALQGERVLSTVIMWGVYFLLAIYFYCRWKKDIKTGKITY